MVVAGVAGSRVDVDEFFEPARKKDFPNWLLRRPWPIPFVALLAFTASRAGPRDCGLDRGLLLSGCLHGGVELDLLEALPHKQVGCRGVSQRTAAFGAFAVGQLA